jgi:hypothetical protein
MGILGYFIGDLMNFSYIISIEIVSYEVHSTLTFTLNINGMRQVWNES